MSEHKTLVEVQHLQQYFPAGGVGKNRKYVQAVDDVSFAIRKGETLGLVGESGCGKTTILRLLSSIIQPDSGRIVLYDALGKETEGTGMRSHIVYIEQGNTLMSGTIRDNLLLANPVATDEQRQQLQRDAEDINAAYKVIALDRIGSR